MTHPNDSLFLDAVVRVDNLQPPGRDAIITSDTPHLAELAKILKVDSLEQFAAKLVIVPVRGGVQVLGAVKARVTQPSVVSFAPVIQDIDEPIDRVFMPSGHKPSNPAPGSEVFVDLADEVPDPLDGPELDLTDLLVESIALAIDPYPRLPGETLDSLNIDLGNKESSPFAALKGLKDTSGKNE